MNAKRLTPARASARRQREQVQGSGKVSTVACLVGESRAALVEESTVEESTTGDRPPPAHTPLHGTHTIARHT